MVSASSDFLPLGWGYQRDSALVLTGQDHSSRPDLLTAAGEWWLSHSRSKLLRQIQVQVIGYQMEHLRDLCGNCESVNSYNSNIR